MATKSIGATGRDYSTLAAWATYVNALTLSAAELGECYADSEFTPGAVVTIGGYTGASGTNTVTLKCAAGQSFRDNANVLTNALRYNSANGVAVNGNIAGGYSGVIHVTGTFFTLDGLQVKNTNATAEGAFSSASATSLTVQNCIFSGNCRSQFLYFCYFNGDSQVVYNNVVILQSTTGRATQYVAGGGIYQSVIDNTVVNVSGAPVGTGLYIEPGSNPVFKNNAVAGFGAADSFGTAGSGTTNNATDQSAFAGTGFGTSAQVSLVATTEWQSVTSGSEDLRVKTGSAKLKSNGATTGPVIDIANTSRTAPYTIGCWQVPNVTNTTITPSVGALAITGTTVGRTLIQVYTPSVGTLAISGLAPVITRTDNHPITPSVGTLTITGQAPTVTATTNEVQLGLSIGDSLVCYTELTHVRAAMGQSGLDSILYTAP